MGLGTLPNISWASLPVKQELCWNGFISATEWLPGPPQGLEAPVALALRGQKSSTIPRLTARWNLDLSRVGVINPGDACGDNERMSPINGLPRKPPSAMMLIYPSRPACVQKNTFFNARRHSIPPCARFRKGKLTQRTFLPAGAPVSLPQSKASQPHRQVGFGLVVAALAVSCFPCAITPNRVKSQKNQNEPLPKFSIRSTRR